jgi:CRISPR/Cas system-associated protein Cas10 (large subunit of type III CRISPR-Cas system)
LDTKGREVKDMAIGIYIVYSKGGDDVIGVFTSYDAAKECAEKYNGFMCTDEAYDSFQEWKKCQFPI